MIPKQDLIDFFRKFSRFHSNSPRDFGVCSKFLGEFGLELSGQPWSGPMFKDWPRFTGEYGYPVPSPTKKLSPAKAYFLLLRWSGRYGTLRRAFCKHAANWIKQNYDTGTTL